MVGTSDAFSFLLFFFVQFSQRQLYPENGTVLCHNSNFHRHIKIIRHERDLHLRHLYGRNEVSLDVDPAVSSSIFVGAEREENLIGMIPTRASLRLQVSLGSQLEVPR